MKEIPFNLRMDGEDYVRRLEKLLEAGLSMSEARRDLHELESMGSSPLIGPAAHQVAEELDNTPVEAIGNKWLEAMKSRVV